MYSDRLNNGEYASDIAKELANKHDNVFRIQDIELGKLLSDKQQIFEEAYFRARNADYLANRPGFKDLSITEQFEILKIDHDIA